MDEPELTPPYRVITGLGLREQSLLDGDEKLATISNPRFIIENKLHEIYERIPDERALVIGFYNTFFSSLGSMIDIYYATMLPYYLAETLSKIDEVRNAESLIDINSNFGFLGNYAAKNFEGLKDGRIIIAGQTTSMVQSAIVSYLLNNGLRKKDVMMTKQGEKGALITGYGNQVVEVAIGPPNLSLYGQEAEIALAVPVYAPIIEEGQPRIFEMLGKIARHVRSELYFVHSSLADMMVEDTAERIGVEHTVIDSREFNLPLRRDNSSESIFKFDEILEDLVSFGLTVHRNGEKEEYKHMARVSKYTY